ncbi:MAG: hypothetical protein GWN62_29870, partial [Aliifodinibius sp.]|nr:hypothetical protein [Fodinibius sp.]
EVTEEQPEVVVFHSRRSVNRTLAAFPNLNYEQKQVITGDKAVSDKLKKEGIETD